MADSYSQATVAPFLPMDELAKKVFSELRAHGDAETTEEVLAALVAIDPDFADIHTTNHSSVPIGMNYEADGVGTYYFYCENSTDDLCMAFLQWLLQRECCKDIKNIQVEGANTCSKMRPGEFGGFAVFITRENIKWLSTSQWLSECETESFKV
jgi:hypothetical protein